MSTQTNTDLPNKFSKKTIRDIDVYRNRRVSVRVDSRMLPVDKARENNQRQPDQSYAANDPLFEQEQESKIILCSPFRSGPNGKVVESMRLRFLADRLG